MLDATPTDEQGKVLDLFEGSANLCINSLAGTGKTTMLRMIDAEINGSHPVLYLAFNRRVVDEALEPDGEGDRKFNSTTDIRTINGQGHRTWGAHISGKLVVNGRKTYELLTQAIKTLAHKSDQDEAWEQYHQIVAAVAFAKALGYRPGKTVGLIDRAPFFARFAEEDEELSALAEDLVDSVLFDSIKASYQGAIDYNDQVYMPALFGVTFPRYPDVLGDEAQDWSPINHLLLKRLTKKSRLAVVGDPWQSIYAFRGAFVGGMAHLVEEKKMTTADLSISFRCPELICRNVHWHVPKLRWFKTGGHVEHLTKLDTEDIPDGCAIICRNNAPLLRLAFRLLRIGRSVSVAGSDVGAKVAKILDKLGDASWPRERVYAAINEWEEDRLNHGSATAKDIADCMRVFATHGKTLGEAVSWAEHIFKQKGTITLITGHKAKGLEWDRVYHLDPWIIKEGEQEDNLKYVISTRAKQELYEIDSRDIQ